MRVATEDYLRSRRIFNTTSSVNTHDDDPFPLPVLARTGKGKGKFCKGKENHTGESYGEPNSENPCTSKVNVEIVSSTNTKLLTVGTNSRRLKAKQGESEIRSVRSKRE